MAKVIRPTYPVELSIGLLILAFAVSFFLSGQIFKIPGQALSEGNAYFGMFLVSTAVLVMLLVLWEEFLFPVKVKPTEEGFVFRNHRNKLKTQLLIYLIIPAIFAFIYLNFHVNLIRFIIWSSVCIVLPVAGKLISGLKNYNDFLKLNNDNIEYKNNEQQGVFKLSELKHITLVRDQRKILHKIQLLTLDNKQVTIDLDEMELEAYYASIDKIVSTRYKNLLGLDSVSENQ